MSLAAAPWTTAILGYDRGRMEQEEPRDESPPDAASPRFAWAIVAILAVAVVALAYAGGARTPAAEGGRARHAAELAPAFRNANQESEGPHSTEVVRPAVAPDRSHLGGKSGTLDEHDDFIRQLTEALATVGAADSTTSDVLVATKRKLLDLLPRVPADMSDASDDIAVAIMNIDHALVPKMRNEANALCAISSTTRSEGLAKYAAAEDCVRKALEDAIKSRNKTDEAAYTPIYKSLLTESDAYTERVVTPAFIESIPWKDLLSTDMAANWSRTTNVPGFSFRIANGVLTTTPPDAGSKMIAVVGILDQREHNLRHLVLDMEFAVEGTVTMYLHVAPPPGSPNNLQSEAYDLQTGATGLTPGAKYTLAATYVGSDLDIKVTGNSQSFTEYSQTSSWAKRRRGGIAFLLPEGARLTITRMRIKELR